MHQRSPSLSSVNWRFVNIQHYTLEISNYGSSSTIFWPLWPQVNNLMIYPDFEQHFELFEPLRSMMVSWGCYLIRFLGVDSHALMADPSTMELPWPGAFWGRGGLFTGHCCSSHVVLRSTCQASSSRAELVGHFWTVFIAYQFIMMT